MNIIESKNYKKSYNKILKNKIKEQQRVVDIIRLINVSRTLHDVVINPLSLIYHIEQKSGNLREYYTARIDNKMRLLMKPIGEYPYNTMEIVEIEFVDIDNKHYGEG